MKYNNTHTHIHTHSLSSTTVKSSLAPYTDANNSVPAIKHVREPSPRMIFNKPYIRPKQSRFLHIHSPYPRAVGAGEWRRALYADCLCVGHAGWHVACYSMLA